MRPRVSGGAAAAADLVEESSGSRSGGQLGQSVREVCGQVAGSGVRDTTASTIWQAEPHLWFVCCCSCNRCTNPARLIATRTSTWFDPPRAADACTWTCYIQSITRGCGRHPILHFSPTFQQQLQQGPAVPALGPRPPATTRLLAPTPVQQPADTCHLLPSQGGFIARGNC
jgi:hypothetical protein